MDENEETSRPSTSKNSTFLDLRKSTLCILLKVLDTEFNKSEYHNNLIYYPVDRITGKDFEEVNFNLKNH